MKLKPIIASYSGESTLNIKQCLDKKILKVIAGIARSPRNITDIAQDVLAELVEMHVLKEQGGLVTLDTSVFFKKRH